jgi:hypothetical protein
LVKDKSNTHRPTALTIYFVASALFALISYALRRGTPGAAVHGVASGSKTLAVVLLILVVVLTLLWLKFESAKRVGGWTRAMLARSWHFLLGWLGAGLASYAVAELVALSGASVPNVMWSALLGPAAFLVLPSPLFVVILLAGWSVAVAEILTKTDLAANAGTKGSVLTIGKHLRGAVNGGTSYAPSEKPDDGHFVQTEKAISRYVIKVDKLASRVPLGVAELAPDWGRKLKPVELGLPLEGSGLIIGAPGSGKGLLLQRAILNVEHPDLAKGELYTKLVVLSTKPRDLAGPTVRWLRSQHMDVQMWDLTGSTVQSNRYGDPVRWSPLSSSTTYDAAKRTAKRLVESGRDTESKSRDEFWLTQSSSLLGPCLLAALFAGKSYEDALKWTQSWSDPDFNEVDRILFAFGQTDALRSWQDTRKMLLQKEGDLSWKEQHGMSSSGATGMSIAATLNGLMLGLATESAYRATANPNFNPRDWVRRGGGAALFMVGNTQEKGMTRSLLATALHELLNEANGFAREYDDERLPYRLIVLGDELANLCPLPDLSEFFSTARSTRIQIMGVFQSYGQIEDVYGREIARVLFDASIATVILSGISDPQLINTLSTIGGSQRVELNEDSVTARPLLEGHDITALRPPDPTTGDPGDALLIMSGGIAKLKVPFWSLEPRYHERGELLPQYETSMATLRQQAHPFQAAWDRWFTTAKFKPANVTKASPPVPTSSPAPRPLRPLLAPPAPVALPRPLVRCLIDLSASQPVCGTKLVHNTTGEVVICGDRGILCPTCAGQF